MKTPKPKARRAWANYYDPLPILYSDKGSARFCSSGYGIQHPVVPVAVIPLDDVESLLGKALRAYERAETTRHDEAMRYTLAAIGVLPRARKGRK